MVVIPGSTELPGNMALGATRSPQLAEQAGRILAREIAAVGVNMNFAPTIDVNSNPQNPVIGARAFGDDPKLVSELGTAMIRGIESEGVIATAKHFLGHGDIALDTHYDAPVVRHDIMRLESVELAPFRSAVDAHVGAIMTSHIIYTALDDSAPASISRRILTDLLRDQLGYDGLIITDAMDMQAVAQFGALKSVIAALQAGADLILLGHLPNQIELTRQTAHFLNTDSLRRIRRAQAKLPTTLPDLEVVGCAEHQQIAQTIAEQSITVVRDRLKQIPLQLDEDAQLGLIHVEPTNLTPADTSDEVALTLDAALRRRHRKLAVATFPREAQEDAIRDALNTVADAETVIVGVIQAERDESQAEVVRALIRQGKQPIVVSLRTPYDITAFPKIDAYVCAYGVRDVSMEAVARVLFGEISATGELPCAIPGVPQTV
jgi:beta-N-acetylhexosaminidase